MLLGGPFYDECGYRLDSVVLRSLGERPLPNTVADAGKRNHAVEFVVSLDGETLTPNSVQKISDISTGNAQ